MGKEMAVLPIDHFYSGRNRTVTEQALRTNAERYSLILANESAGVCIDNPVIAALLACADYFLAGAQGINLRRITEIVVRWHVVITSGIPSISSIVALGL